MKSKKTIFWFRRDLRLQDNAALFQALQSGQPVLPLFIFDRNILDKLEDSSDGRVLFIHRRLQSLNRELRQNGSGLQVEIGSPPEVWQKLIGEGNISQVYANRDYEPYGIQRDKEVGKLLKDAGIPFHTDKDHLIFEPGEILKADETPYTVFTAYKNRWLREFRPQRIVPFPSEKYLQWLLQWTAPDLPTLAQLGFQETAVAFPSPILDEKIIREYHLRRDFPALDATSRLGVHLRFGTVSIRRAVEAGLQLNETWLSELIWREFFMMLLYHFPHTADQPFREKFSKIPWRRDEKEFHLWCKGKTGFPLVDAGMRQLNATGFMHNRVRMLTANFLTKLLLIDWRWGERYFAAKLLDYEQASNVGNWQWSAGCGADASPYFRIFNPDIQIKKFDTELQYIKRWVPEYGTAAYPHPVLDYRSAREFSLNWFRSHSRE